MTADREQATNHPGDVLGDAAEVASEGERDEAEFDRHAFGLGWSAPLGDSDGGSAEGRHVTPEGNSQDAMSVTFIGPDLRARALEMVQLWESMNGPPNSVYETCARDLRQALNATTRSGDQLHALADEWITAEDAADAYGPGAAYTGRDCAEMLRAVLTSFTPTPPPTGPLVEPVTAEAGVGPMGEVSSAAVYGMCTHCGAVEVRLNRPSGVRDLSDHGESPEYPIGFGCEVCA